MPTVRYSVVIPIFNEELVLAELMGRLLPVVDGLDGPAEVIFVDDGSHDRSLELLSEHVARDPRVRVLQLSRNFGHQSAITAGLDAARGDAVIMMDGDLQDPPEMIPRFIEKWQEGNQIVYAVKTKRRESLPRRFAFAAFYWLLNALSSIKMPPQAGIFSLLDRQVVDVLKSMPERNRYLSGMRCWAGFRQAGLEFARDPRFAGRAKQSLARLVWLALDAIFSFSYIPIRIVAVTGIAMTVVDFFLIIFVLHRKLFTTLTIPGWTSLLITIMFIGGLQLMTLGIIGEYIARIYEEAKGRPSYVVMRRYNFPEA